MARRQREATPDLCAVCGASWDCEHTARKPERRKEPDDADRIAADMAQYAKENSVHVTWREAADFVLARLFDNGNFTPSPQEIKDAYPFGIRKHYPYKVWCEQVRWWKAGCPDKRYRKPSPKPLSGQERLF